MIDKKLLRGCLFAGLRSARVASRTSAASLLSSLLLIAAILPAPARANQGDCSQPLTTGADPTATDCLFILKAAVQSETCAVECICAPKGTLPISASDALVCLKGAVGQSVILDCPCEATTTTTTTTTTTPQASGVVGAISFQGRMNANQKLGLPAASAACDEHFPDSHFCVHSEVVASQGSRLAGLEDVDGANVTSLWAIDPDQSLARQCGQSLNSGAPLWTYNTGHLGVGGDSVALNNGTGMLGSFSVGGGANRNCSDTKWVACCK